MLLALLPPGIAPPAAAGLAWTIEVADGQYGTGGYNSIALAPDGSPGISYNADRELRYAWRDAGGWHNVTVDRPASGTAGYGTSLAIDRSGVPHIGHIVWDSGGQMIWYAYWNASLSSWVKELAGDAGQGLGRTYLSLALDSSGAPHIAYIHSETAALLYASPAGPWTSETVGVVGCCRAISLRLDSQDVPHLAAYNYTLQGLEYYRKEGASWPRETVEAPASVGSFGISLALNGSDRPRIAYVVAGFPGPQLKYANRTSTTWSIRTVPTSLDLGSYVSLALDPNDQPRIAYTDRDAGYLKYSYREAGLWQTVLVDGDSVWLHASLAYDPSGVAHIAYLGKSSTVVNLKYAKGATFNELPTSSVQAVTPYWWTSGPLPVQATASDPDGTAARVDLFYRFDAGAGWGPWTLHGSDPAPPWAWTFPFPQGEGRYELHSLAFDGKDWEANKTSAEASAGYDATRPVSSAMPITPYWHANPQMTVNATASDALSGVASVTLLYAYAPDNATWGPWTPFVTLLAPPWSWSFSFPDGEGNYRFHTVARDVAENVEGSKTSAEVIAGYRLPPDYAPANPRPSSRTTVGVSLSITLSVEVANLAGIANTTATLAFYNASTSGVPFATFPLPPIPAESTTGPFAATWTSPAVPGTSAVSVSVDYRDDVAESNESNDVYTWTVVAVPGPVTILVVGAPNVTAGATYVTSSTPLSFAVLDQSGTGIRSTTYRVDGGPWVNYTATGSFTLACEGLHLVEWYSEDFAGSVEAVASATLVVDCTPPATTAVIGDPKYLVGGTFVTSATPLALTAADGGPIPVGLLRSEYRIDDDPWTPYAVPFAVAGGGPHVVAYRSVDRLGNLEPDVHATVVVDDTPPTSTVDVGDPKYVAAETYVTSSTPLSLAASDGGADPVGLASLEYRFGGGPWTPYVAPFTGSGPDGPVTVDIRASDFLGNTATPSVDLVIDDTPPVTTPSRTDGTYPTGTTFAFAAEDAGSGVASTEHKVDGGSWTTYGGPFALSEGDHVIRFRSTDRVNNTEAERTLSVTIEGAPPVPPEPNWKPVVAVVFASVLALAGAWSARRASWPTGSRGRLHAFALTALPFVLAEAATGVVSLLTGLLAIPPLLGLGTVVDLGILVGGIVVAGFRVPMRMRLE